VFEHKHDVSGPQKKSREALTTAEDIRGNSETEVSGWKYIEVS